LPARAPQSSVGHQIVIGSLDEGKKIMTIKYYILFIVSDYLLRLLFVVHVGVCLAGCLLSTWNTWSGARGNQFRVPRLKWH